MPPSFLDTPPIHVYCAAKAGVLGLMRSLRTQLPRDNITINMVAPWMTRTQLLPPQFEANWGHLPANEPEGPARALLLPVVRPDMNGRSLFVAGHDIIDLEAGLQETQPKWMGEELSEAVDEGQRLVTQSLVH